MATAKGIITIANKTRELVVNMAAFSFRGYNFEWQFVPFEWLLTACPRCWLRLGQNDLWGAPASLIAVKGGRPLIFVRPLVGFRLRIGNQGKRNILTTDYSVGDNRLSVSYLPASFVMFGWLSDRSLLTSHA